MAGKVILPPTNIMQSNNIKCVEPYKFLEAPDEVLGSRPQLELDGIWAIRHAHHADKTTSNLLNLLSKRRVWCGFQTIHIREFDPPE